MRKSIALSDDNKLDVFNNKERKIYALSQHA
jgi:hypothetical protein